MFGKILQSTSMRDEEECKDLGERRNGSLADESTTLNLGLF
jgi:hypothetical protein